MTEEIPTKSSTEDQPLPTPTHEGYVAWVSFDLHVSGWNKLISNFITEIIYTSTLNDLLWHLDDFVLFVQQKLKPEKDLVRNVVMVVVGAKTHTDILQEI